MKLAIAAVALCVGVLVCGSNAQTVGTCTENNVSSESSCMTWCESSFVYYEPVTETCACPSGLSCTNYNGGGFDDEAFGFDDDETSNDDAFGPPQDSANAANGADFSFEDAINAFIQLLPQSDQARCRSVIEGALSPALFDCIISGALDGDDDNMSSLDDDGFTAADIAAQCDNSCLRLSIQAAFSLFNSDCIPFDGDFDVESINAQGTLLDLACTRGGDAYCGELFPIFEEIIVNGQNATEMQCMAIANAGKCAGNFVYVFETEIDSLPDDITRDIPSGTNFTEVVSMVAANCMQEYNVDLEQSIAGTEAPANLASSGAFSVTVSVFGFVAAAALAMLF